MIQAVAIGLSSLAMALFMPMILLEPIPADAEQALVVMVEEAKPSYEISLQTGGDIVSMELEEYLVGVVLSEMPASFHLEALKAQCVAARTFTMHQIGSQKHNGFDLCDDSSCCQAWCSEAAIMDKLGENCHNYIKKAQEAVSATEGEVLTYDGALIEAVYFSCSGGKTENAVAVWGNDVPYLQSVESLGEEAAAKFQTQVYVPLSSFCQTIKNSWPGADLTGNPAGWFGACKRTEGGGVETLKIGGKLISGTDLRKAFHLNSTNFSVSVEDDGICFDVIGYGHRVGMSQYGANAMAETGKDYRQILHHYYTDVEIAKK